MAVDESAIGAISEASAPEFALPQKRKWWQGVLHFIRKKPLGAIGFAIVGLMFIATLGWPTGNVGAPSLPDAPLGFEMGAPWFQRYGPEETFYAGGRLRIFEEPSSNHWLGTDKNGRDTWSRMVNGARRSLYIGIWALVIATVIGTTIGVISGYFAGAFDTFSQRGMDALQAFPPLVALILIVTIQPFTDGPSLTLAAVALGIVGIAAVQRIVRGVVLATAQQQYVEAARVVGATNSRIMIHYILPNIMASIIVVFSIGLGSVILAEAALSFVVPDKMPQGPSWGITLADSYPVIADQPWPGVSAALGIALAVLGFNLAGDALRDVLDPRLRVG
jgi:peptide/nickel transport system permease protein